MRVWEIERLLIKAGDVGRSRVERLARAAMRRHTKCKSFCMGMGIACFYDSKGRAIDQSHPAYGPLYNFLMEYDDYLKITGLYMSITGHDGKVKGWKEPAR